jgi:hypothetical protein
VTVEGNIYLGGGSMVIFGVLFLIGVGVTAVGSFANCILETKEGMGELGGDVIWLAIAVGLLVHGIKARSGGEIGASVFMFFVVGLFGLLTWVFHWEDKWWRRSETSAAASERCALPRLKTRTGKIRAKAQPAREVDRPGNYGLRGRPTPSRVRLRFGGVVPCDGGRRYGGRTQARTMTPLCFPDLFHVSTTTVLKGTT